MMPDAGISELLLLLVLMLAIGALAGIIAGMLGVGGGIVLVPAFFYVFTALGYDSPYVMQIALATSLATIVFTSWRSVRVHDRKNTVEWATLRGWAPGIALGAFAGVFTATALKSTTLQGIFGVLGVMVGLYMAFGRPHWRLGDQMPSGIVRAVLSPVLGFFSVLMGIGGGSLGVPLMTLYGLPIHRAVATAAGFGILIAVPAAAVFLFVPVPAEYRPPFTIGAVNLIAFAVIMSTTMITTTWGVHLAHKLDPKPLKRVFACFLIVVAANMLRKALGF